MSKLASPVALCPLNSQPIQLKQHEARALKSLTAYKKRFADSLAEPEDVHIEGNQIVVSAIKEITTEIDVLAELGPYENHVVISGPAGLRKAVFAHLAARERGCQLLRLDPSLFESHSWKESERIGEALRQFLEEAGKIVVLLDSTDYMLSERTEAAAHMRCAILKHLLPNLGSLPYVMLVATTDKLGRPRLYTLERMAFFRMQLPAASVEKKELIDLPSENAQLHLSKELVTETLARKRSPDHVPEERLGLLDYSNACKPNSHALAV